MDKGKKRVKLTRLQFFALCAAAIYLLSALLNYTGTFDEFKLNWWDWLITSFEARKPPRDLTNESLRHRASPHTMTGRSFRISSRRSLNSTFLPTGAAWIFSSAR